MKNSVNLPEPIANKSLQQLINQPGTRATIETKENRNSLSITRKEKDYSVHIKIDTYPDGTRTESHTLSPASKASDKKGTMEEMRSQGLKQREIAERTGFNQSTVSKILNK